MPLIEDNPIMITVVPTAAHFRPISELTRLLAIEPASLTDDERFHLAGMLEKKQRGKGRPKGKTPKQATEERQTLKRVEALRAAGLSKAKAMEQRRSELGLLTVDGVKKQLAAVTRRDRGYRSAFEQFVKDEQTSPLDEKLKGK